MSSKAISAASTHFLQFRLQYSSLALLYFDYALTFPKEIEYMWKQRFRLSTALYIGCRYALVANVLYLLAIAQKLGSTCDFWYKVVAALSVVGRAAVIAAFCIRTHAVWGQNRWILLYMGVIGLAHMSRELVVSAPQRSQSPEMLSVLMVIFESSAAFLTIVRCIIAFRAGGGFKNRRDGLMFVLFEQGILYFCTISIFTTAAVVLNYRAPPGFFQRLPNAFTLPLSCILTARFLLHLREWEAESSGSEAKLSTLNFGGESRPPAAGNPGTGANSSSSWLSGIMSTADFGEDFVTVAVTGRESHERSRREKARKMELQGVDGCSTSGTSDHTRSDSSAANEGVLGGDNERFGSPDVSVV